MTENQAAAYEHVRNPSSEVRAFQIYMPSGVDHLLQANLDIGSAAVIAAHVEVLSGLDFPRCGRWRKRHEWRQVAVTTGGRHALRRSFACNRCHVAFEIDASGSVQRWNVTP